MSPARRKAPGRRKASTNSNTSSGGPRRWAMIMRSWSGGWPGRRRRCGVFARGTGSFANWLSDQNGQHTTKKAARKAQRTSRTKGLAKGGRWTARLARRMSGMSRRGVLLREIQGCGTVKRTWLAAVAVQASLRARAKALLLRAWPFRRDWRKANWRRTGRRIVLRR